MGNGPTMCEALRAMREGYVAEVNAEATDLLADAKSYQSHGDFAQFPSAAQAALRADIDRLRKTKKAFNNELNKALIVCVYGEEPDAGPVVDALGRYDIAMQLLEQTNARFDAVLGSGLVAEALLLVTWVKWGIGTLKRRMENCEKKYKDVARELEKAAKLVKDKAMKRNLGAAADVAFMVAGGFATGGAGWAVAAGSIAVSFAIDVAYSGRNWSQESLAIGVMGEMGDAAAEAKKLKPKVAGKLATGVNVALDHGEVKAAEAALNRAKAALREASREHDWIYNQIGAREKFIRSIARAYKSARDKAKANMKTVGKNAKRQRLLAELQTLQ